MSVAATTAPAQGWYPDPHDSAQLRWWDGSGWTAYTTDVPQAEPEPQAEPHPFTDIIVDLAESDDDLPEDAGPLDDEELDVADAEAEPIDFSWADPEERFEVTVPEWEPEPSGFAFRARALPQADVAVATRPEPEPVAVVEVPAVPVYESPLATIASPIPVRIEVPVRVEVPVEVPVAEPVRETEATPEPHEAEALPAPAVPVRPNRRRIALAGTGAVVAVAAAAAGIANIAGGDGKPSKAAAAPAGLSAPAKRCLKEWNTAATGSAAQLRVTVGQFEGALARVAPVKPLPNTVMAADSCALTVYDPSLDTHAIFVSGVEDTIGYVDVTSYPRASTYGWPKNEGQTNVAIRPDGSIRGL
jgi:hypothetical protein